MEKPEREKQSIGPNNDQIGRSGSVSLDSDWLDFRKQVAELAQVLEKMRLAEYIGYLNRPGRLLWINLAVGLVRGLGVAIGASILAGVAIMVLKWLGFLNLPLIGGFIAELVKIVNYHIGNGGAGSGL